MIHLRLWNTVIIQTPVLNYETAITQSKYRKEYKTNTSAPEMFIIYRHGDEKARKAVCCVRKEMSNYTLLHSPPKFPLIMHHHFHSCHKSRKKPHVHSPPLALPTPIEQDTSAHLSSLLPTTTTTTLRLPTCCSLSWRVGLVLPEG